tara:strand:+ start:99 stop:1325 length:1227 start_codon:yes stop_codon:yes gene_type:complete
MEQTINRSVWGTSTDDFKRHFRKYLRELADSHDDYRRDLIARLEWAFDRWEHFRQKFFANTAAPLMFPFFVSGRRGNEFGHYSTVGDSGQPSVIHLKRAFLMGTNDITVWKMSTKRLVLKKDHPKRHLFVQQTILHELVHQYLHEAAPAELRLEYETTEAKGYRGHGPLFASECNRINQTLHPELGFEFVAVRHMKRSHARRADVQRPSCAQFTHGDLFFCWDPDAKDLSDQQLAENEARLQQALDYYGGAVEVVETPVVAATEFSAPFSSDCASSCLQELLAYDRSNETQLVKSFQLEVLRDLMDQNQLADALVEVGFSSAPSDISPVQLATPATPAAVPARRDSLRDVYPLDDAEESLAQLDADIKVSGLKKEKFAAWRFGHKNGQQLSRHLKKLREAVQPAEAAA